MSLDQTVGELREEISQLRRMMFIAATALLVGLMLWNLSMWNPGNLWGPMRAERIFEDMLGSQDNLPDLTKMVLKYCRAANGWLPIAMIVSFTAVAWSLMSIYKHKSMFMLIAIIAAFILCAHRGLIALAIEMPLMHIIQGINGK
ncbi:MAG: hypothetical protein K8R87_12910 [Verrucomicrobia bacterium]|nr:hypothetical protein [Verrucomicrobiota bacterium]